MNNPREKPQQGTAGMSLYIKHSSSWVVTQTSLLEQLPESTPGRKGGIGPNSPEFWVTDHSLYLPVQFPHPPWGTTSFAMQDEGLGKGKAPCRSAGIPAGPGSLLREVMDEALTPSLSR